MKYQFEIISTVNIPLIISVDNNVTIRELRNKIIDEVIQSTIFIEDDILDIFVHDALSYNTLSIPNSKQILKDFIPMNRDFFPFGLISKNTYKIYIIDKMYCERLKKCIYNSNKKKREIKTNHFGFIEKFISCKYTPKIFKS